MPLPIFPVDSASSCSSHAPRSEMPGEVMIVTLSRPALAAVPRMMPSTRQDFLRRPPRLRRRAPSRLRSRETSSCPAPSPPPAPCRNSTARNSVRQSTDVRRKRAGSDRPSATCCIFDPGSVIAMNWLPAFVAPTACFVRSKKYCLKMLGSRVLPDLLDTMKSVLGMSIRCSNAFTWAGSVESSTWRVGKWLIRAEGHAQNFRTETGSTHAQKQHMLKPARSAPPSRTSAVGPAARSARRQCRASPASWLSSLPVQSVASRCHKRCILPPDCQSAIVAFTVVASDSGREVFSRLTIYPFCCVLFATAASSLSKASANNLTPSSVSLSVTSFIEMPARARSSIVFVAPGTSSMRLLRSRP